MTDVGEDNRPDAAMVNTRATALPSEHIVQRDSCVMTGATDFEPLLTLRDFPVGMYCVPEDWEGTEYFTDMHWSICKSSGVIQLTRLIELTTLYDCQHESGAIGGLWKRHHEEFCNFIDEFGSRAILEIGGGHGHLAKMFTERHAEQCEWIMVEPNLPDWLANGEHSSQIRPIKAWFGDEFELPASAPKIDAVVHSHTLEHLYNYDNFLRAVARMEPKYQIFSVPYQQEWLRRGWQNSIMFEHPQMLTPKSIEYIMARHGFSLEKKRIFADCHSLFYAFSHKGKDSATVPKLELNEYHENKLLFQNWLKTNVDFVQRVNARIDKALKTEKEPSVYIFGAHIFTQYLVSFGLRASVVSAILDNATGKQGKRLYGLPLMVYSPKILVDKKQPIIILRVGAYAEEIKRGILEVNANAVFLE